MTSGDYAYGSPPFGWIAVGGELVEDAAEQRALQRMRELRAIGKSYRDIAATLSAEGHEPKRGTCWYPMTVREVLRR